MLTITGSNILSMHEDTWWGLEGLRRLILPNNMLNVTPPLTHIASTLRELDLSHNEINVVYKDYFQNCTSMRRLLFDYNYLYFLPDLSHVRNSLLSFRFSNNLIVWADPIFDNIFPVLDYFDITNNHISVPEDFACSSILEVWPNIHEVFISPNDGWDLSEFKKSIGCIQVKLIKFLANWINDILMSTVYL